LYLHALAAMLAASVGTATMNICSASDAPAASSPAQLPVEGEIPSLDGATAWLNSAPLSPKSLRGHVVLVEFWTYTCVNWRRTLPYVRTWAQKYRDSGLIVIGVHTPEFSFEKDPGNVRTAVSELGIRYPVAMDNDYAVWSAFANEYWPALYFIDSQGRIRHHHFGEGDYDRSERVIQQLLAETGETHFDRALVSVDPQGAEEATDWSDLESPESYVGSAREQNFASRGGLVAGRNHTYAAPANLTLNEWALSGDWLVAPEAVSSTRPGGRITYRFHARDLNLVMGPAESGAPVRFRVLIDGQPPGSSHGTDVDSNGNGRLVEPRLYQLIRQSAPIGDHVFEIEFLDPGAQAFDFTFG
jgi:thiol-disulfide isomerase/thioredoxin